MKNINNFYNSFSNTNHNWIFGEDSIKYCIDSIKSGSCLIIVDNEDRENEGDLIMASLHATPELIS